MLLRLSAEPPTTVPVSPWASFRTPPVAVIGTATVTIAGTGLSLLGAGALALLAARRRRLFRRIDAPDRWAE